MSTRLKILMLVPHEPSLDPRVHYTANALARVHDVQVLATVRAKERRPTGNSVGAARYSIERLPLTLLPRPGTAVQALKIPPAQVAAVAGRPSSSAPGVHEKLAGGIKQRVRGNAASLLMTLSVNHVLQRYLQKTGLRPDIVFCHDLSTLQTGVLLKQRTGARLVYDSHEYYPFQYLHPTFVETTLWYERKLVSHVDLYLTVSPQLARELEAVYGVSPIHVIPNAEPRPSGTVRPLGSEMDRRANGRLKVLFQGSFSPGRGLEEVLTEWLQVDADKAALFLRGPEDSVLAGLRDEARRLGLLDRSVFVLPPVLEKDLIPAAAEADVGLIPYKGDLPSYRFACPNKLSQYIHAGLALIGNDIPFVAEMIRSNGIGWVYDVNKPGSLAAAVAAALAADARSAARARAATLSQGGYCWEKYEPELLDLVAATMGASS